ncbi:helix-turn-helix domain-containing protein [Tabrizicola soli]|uniref:Helix-turn-helix domain-containing protein n=1 Tax=Tabrizicola soli TaxID=2185115 RepID=A0ABV7DS55_9RHOB|nr:XRE family transcriptional regulator [Tabrizicola soli]
MAETVMPAGEDPATPELDILARRVKRFRQARRLSLRQLGELSGTTASFLSQLERGATGATTSTLMRIANALDISIADLFDDRPRSTHRVLRKAERPSWPEAAGYRKMLLSQRPIQDFEVFVGEFDVGGSTGPEQYTHGDSHEMMLVIAGEVELHLAEEIHRLSEGDCIEYASSTPHRTVNCGTRIATVQWIISPPSGYGAKTA